MRDFEKKLSLKLKKEAERLAPEYREFDFNTEMKEGTEENQRSNPDTRKRRPVLRKGMIAAAVAILFFVSIFSFDSLFEKESNYSFQIISFADSNGMDRNQLEEKLLDANISMVMPNGQIMLNPAGMQGIERWSYGWGTGSFYVTGENIERVTYSLKNGMISHYDTAMEYKKNLEGNPVRIEFFLPYTALNLDETQADVYEREDKFIERLKELWNSGECPELEAVKKGYFVGKSPDIEDYTIMSFVGTWAAAQTDGRYFRFRDIALDEELNKEAHEVTVEYYHFDYGEQFNFSDSIYSVLWSPKFKPYATVGVTNPKELPGDEMTVTIELQNGEIIKKVILLTYDEDGYVIAKIK